METVDQVFAAVMALPQSDRLSLPERLFEAIRQDDIETELAEELQDVVANRIAAYKRGETETFDADEALDEIERSIELRDPLIR